MNPSKLFPYVVPKSYPQLEGVSRPLGHDVFLQLVEDHGGLCKGCDLEALKSAQLTPDRAHTLAIENLEALRKSKTFDAQMYDGPGDRKFILWYGHWLAAACIVLPSMAEWASRNLQTADVCASIPNRETLLLFPRGDRSYRDAMRQMIQEKEADSPKPITWGLFHLSPTRMTAIVE